MKMEIVGGTHTRLLTPALCTRCAARRGSTSPQHGKRPQRRSVPIRPLLPRLKSCGDELKEAREQQTATSELLSVISAVGGRDPADLRGISH
jgi:hypothetical protein